MAVDDATANLLHYGETEREITRLETEMNDRIAQIQADTEKLVAPLREKRDGLRRALEVFATSYRRRLAKGKTITLPTGRLSWKQGKPSIDVNDETAAKRAIRRLRRAKDFLKITVSIRKAELLKEPEVARRLDGVTYNEAGELFYIDPAEATADTAATGKKG